jgi:signal transduction histidine kinase
MAPLIAAVVQSTALAADLASERNRVVEATQSERARLRQELHDGLGPSLTGIGLGLEAAQASPLAGEPRTSDLLSRLRVEVASSLEEIRRIIDDLRPTVLDDHDLLSALRERGERVTSAAGVTVAVDAPQSLPDLPPEVETAAFRIADEALTNVVRHSGASTCTVHVSVGDMLRLVVSDDGVGVGNGRAGGVGLASMRQRAERIGGAFSVSPTLSGGGTRIVAELPLAVAR